MTDYKYIFGSLRDEHIIAEIPLYGVYLDLELNAGGRFDGTFNLDQLGKDNQTLVDATIPGRTFVAVEREGIPVWIGFVWSRVYQSQSKSCQLYAQSFENYPQYQLVRETIISTAEQLLLFRNMWTSMQSVSGRNMNIFVPTESLTTVISKTLDVVTTDLKYYGFLMYSMSDAVDGFDWYIAVNKTGNTYNKILKYGYPTVGSTDPSLVTFEYPGSILNYYATETMSTAATNVFTIGAGEGSSMLTYESEQDAMIEQGFARWDLVSSRKDISDQLLLNTVGATEGAKRKPPMMVVKPTLKANLEPTFGSFGLGDACNVTIDDPRFPNGFTFNGRIVKWILQPSSSEHTEEFNLLFEGDEEGG